MIINKIKIPDFLISVSFTGDVREDYVKPVCLELMNKLYDSNIFLDEWYQGLLSGPSSDIIIQDIYKKHSNLVVVFISKEYVNRDWTKNIEWNAIRERINRGNGETVLLLGIGIKKEDINEIPGLSDVTSIYADITKYNTSAIAELILDRYKILHGEDSLSCIRPKNLIMSKYKMPEPEHFNKSEDREKTSILQNIQHSYNNSNLIEYTNTTIDILEWIEKIDKTNLNEENLKLVEKLKIDCEELFLPEEEPY